MKDKDRRGADMESQKPYYLYAETAFSHEGDLSYLYKQVDEAASAEVNGIKFQILLEPKESYDEVLIKSSETFKWIFTEDEWKKVIHYAREKKLEVILLPVDMKALEFCENNQDLYEMIEVHSINFNHKFMLERMNRIPNKMIILGVGGRTLADIEYALDKLENACSENRILLMHGFQSFPTRPENLKMERIFRMKNFWGVQVGYADHTSYAEDDLTLMQIAYVNGARYFEKHLVLHRGEKRTDFQAAVDAEHLIRIKEAIESIMQIQGEEKNWGLNDAERTYREREKKVVALNDIRQGEPFTEENLGYKVTPQDKVIEQKDIESLFGTKARRNIEMDSTDVL